MESRDRRIGLEIAIVDVLSGKPMCRVTDLATRYHPANACNGFLLIAHAKNKPVYLCNPITGEKQKVLPPLEMEHVYRRSYAMGFSPPSGPYKLFRLCFPHPTHWFETSDKNYMEVYTFGDDGGGSWRRHPYTFPSSVGCRLRQMPPLLVDGKLYVLMERPGIRVLAEFDRMLVIDVGSEAHGMYHLPERFIGEVTTSVHAFDMGGRLCIARHIAGRRLLHFWVMEPLRGQHMDHKKDKTMYGSWELRYTFYVDECGRRHDKQAGGAWLNNGDGMLCYRLGDYLYIYDTTKDDQRRKTKSDFSEWDHRIQLPAAPSSDKHRWNVYSGYRPSLFSPRNLFYRRNKDEQEKYEHDLAHALRYKHKHIDPPDCNVRCAKRVRDNNS
jgi:F-box interacting protein